MPDGFRGPDCEPNRRFATVFSCVHDGVSSRSSSEAAHVSAVSAPRRHPRSRVPTPRRFASSSSSATGHSRPARSRPGRRWPSGNSCTVTPCSCPTANTRSMAVRRSSMVSRLQAPAGRSTGRPVTPRSAGTATWAGRGESGHYGAMTPRCRLATASTSTCGDGARTAGSTSWSTWATARPRPGLDPIPARVDRGCTCHGRPASCSSAAPG